MTVSDVELFRRIPNSVGEADHALTEPTTTPFSANVLVGFVKSGISWHGLRPLHLGIDEERRTLVINIFARTPVHDPSVRRRRSKTERRSLAD